MPYTEFYEVARIALDEEKPLIHMKLGSEREIRREVVRKAVEQGWTAPCDVIEDSEEEIIFCFAE